MATAKLYNQTGEEKGDVKLNSAIFDIEMKENLVHQVLVAILANRRQVTAHTKDRSEVRGGGAKPWRQKGTGRARHGSRRSPLWVGGGVTFGPTKDRNFDKKVNKKMRQKASLMLLSDKARENEIAVLEDLKMSEPKTKTIRELVEKLKMNKVLVVTKNTDQNIVKSIKNLPAVDVICSDSLNVFDLMYHDNILFTKESLSELDKVYLKK